jgi:hypothetical protein
MTPEEREEFIRFQREMCNDEETFSTTANLVHKGDGYQAAFHQSLSTRPMSSNALDIIKEANKKSSVKMLENSIPSDMFAILARLKVRTWSRLDTAPNQMGSRLSFLCLPDEQREPLMKELDCNEGPLFFPRITNIEDTEKFLITVTFPSAPLLTTENFEKLIENSKEDVKEIKLFKIKKESGEPCSLETALSEFADPCGFGEIYESMRPSEAIKKTVWSEENLADKMFNRDLARENGISKSELEKALEKLNNLTVEHSESTEPLVYPVNILYTSLTQGGVSNQDDAIVEVELGDDSKFTDRDQGEPVPMTAQTAFSNHLQIWSLSKTGELKAATRTAVRGDFENIAGHAEMLGRVFNKHNEPVSMRRLIRAVNVGTGMERIRTFYRPLVGSCRAFQVLNKQNILAVNELREKNGKNPLPIRFRDPEYLKEDEEKRQFFLGLLAVNMGAHILEKVRHRFQIQNSSFSDLNVLLRIYDMTSTLVRDNGEISGHADFKDIPKAQVAAALAIVRPARIVEICLNTIRPEKILTTFRLAGDAFLNTENCREIAQKCMKQAYGKRNFPTDFPKFPMPMDTSRTNLGQPTANDMEFASVLSFVAKYTRNITMEGEIPKEEAALFERTCRSAKLCQLVRGIGRPAKQLPYFSDFVKAYIIDKQLPDDEISEEVEKYCDVFAVMKVADIKTWGNNAGTGLYYRGYLPKKAFRNDGRFAWDRPDLLRLKPNDDEFITNPALLKELGAGASKKNSAKDDFNEQHSQDSSDEESEAHTDQEDDDDEEEDASSRGDAGGDVPDNDLGL